MRPRKPSQQQILEGAPGKRPIPIGNIPDTDIGDPPPGLPKAARKIWLRVGQEWALSLCSSDREALSLYCRTAARHEALERRCDREGCFDFDKDGRMIVSASFRALQQSGAMLTKLFAMFGATPATRGRVPAKTISYPKARRGGLEVLQGGKIDQK